MNKKKDFKVITVKDLKEFISKHDDDTKICVKYLGKNFPAHLIQECTYSNWNDDKETEKFKGILIR